MGNAPTQPDPAEGAPADAPRGPSAPTQPAPAEGADDMPGEQPGSPRG